MTDRPVMESAIRACRIWVLDQRVDASTRERLGDARRLADALSESVGVLVVGKACDARGSIARGADCVVSVEVDCGPAGRLANAEKVLGELRPRLVFASGSPDGREWAARLAARLGWQLIAPTLQAEVDRAGRTVVTRLSGCGRFCRRVQLDSGATAVLTLKPGVAEATTPDPDRVGTVVSLSPLPPQRESVELRREIPADPGSVDIRHAERLVAGGRGVGDRAGMEQLARVAKRLGAGLAASRVAVDLGWIERERQVGQTGKTVAPALYLACGIRGASHHLAGMAQARHVVAINTDPEAPIFEVAHLGLVADLREVLSHLEARLADAPDGRR